MLSIKTLRFFSVIQFIFLDLSALFKENYGSLSFDLDTANDSKYEMQGFTLHNRDGAQFLELRLQREDTCVYFESNILEISSSYDVRSSFQHFAVPLQEMCMTFKCSPTWDGICEAMYFEDESLKIKLSPRDEYYEKKTFIHISNEMRIACHCNWKKMDQPSRDTYSKSRVYKLMNDTKFYFQEFHLFVFGYIFLSIFEYLFLCNFIKKISEDISFQKLETVNEENNGNKLLSTADRYIEGDLKSYFDAGGRHQTAIQGEIVCKYLQTCTDANLSNDNLHLEGKVFDFKGYQLSSTISNNTLTPINPVYYSKIPLEQLSDYLNTKELRDIGALHNIFIPYNIGKNTMMALFSEHQCTQCELYVSVLTEREVKKRLETDSDKLRKKKKRREDKLKKEEERIDVKNAPSKFPPNPPSNMLIESIIKDFCNETLPQKLIERGCAVCGRLVSINDMILLIEMENLLDAISPGDIGRYERLYNYEPVMPLKGPILAEGCEHVCSICEKFLKNKKMPPDSLANSFWIGSIPLVLQGLTFAEKMLISRIRHNRCLVRVSSGRAKMTANVIMFSNPTVKVYHALPPSRKEISEILACVFQGSAQPTDSDIKRTPMLVRRNVVKDALEWLKLNHIDYEDLQISLENLNDYPLAGVPVNIEYSSSNPDFGNKIVSAMSLYDDEIEDGTTEGPCPFTVHGLTGTEFEDMSIEKLKARALQHLVDRGSTLGISHDSNPQSMYDNPQAYPQMFPWLFPYGLGGIGQKCHFAKISDANHKKKLLMYYDKRFQADFYFPMVAFNHEQLKAGVTGSFLLAKKKKWPDISNRLKSLNRDVLKKISEKLLDGVHFSPNTIEEKKCFQLLNDLDHVGGFVKGSITSKKYMRNEIWSMISQLGAPSWFITLSPADSRHPICLYYADKDIEFRPNLRTANERNSLTAQNPVAAARFFDLMVRMFIKHVLGVETEHSGMYGDTSGYYGTVEQQGRLTLHLHTILWIKNALSPQEIRDKLMSNDSEFQKKLIEYLEGCQRGEFLTGSMEYVKAQIPIDVNVHSNGVHAIFQNNSSPLVEKTYRDPTQTLPVDPPNKCDDEGCINCKDCELLTHWWEKFYHTVDDILIRSNVHRCTFSTESKFKAKGCLNKEGICKARFPRPIVLESTVNSEDGYINLKKMESMLNTISPCITYLLRCNTDVTSLLSGTSIKAVISYVTDYIAKSTLKSYQIFAIAYNVFERNSNLDTESNSRTDDARKLILKIVNALSSKMEIGSPMASMYLLQNPDHYTSHQFIPFWWKSFVNDVKNSEIVEERMNDTHSVDVVMKDIGEEEKKMERDYDSDIKMDITSQEEDNCIYPCSTNNGNGGKNEAYIYNIRHCKLDSETFLSQDVKKDVGNLSSYVGTESKVITGRLLPMINENDFQNQIKTDYEIDNQNLVENSDEDEFNIEDRNGNDDEDNGNEDECEEDLNDEKLLISQDGRDFVASSRVDDYKFRPEIYKVSSLYEWSKLYVKKRQSRGVKDDSYHRFLPGHGQLNTHTVKLIPSRNETFVLNFIGGPLPRRDQGDFEYYTCTMLTLFKPWRSSDDLKEIHQTWTEAFACHQFKKDERKIMDNFNLRYECLDERDDYHAILKRQTKMKEKKNPFSFQDQYGEDCGLGIDSDYEEDYGDQKIFGPNTIKKAQQMMETEIMMNKAGWLYRYGDSNLPLPVKEFRSSVLKTGTQWKSIVKESRQKLLNIKRKNVSSIEDLSPNIKMELSQPFNVKLLPPEYFMHNFEAEIVKDREIISNTIINFSLNEEQRRAFKIIANHASEICSEQLKMYLGGMGGTGKTRVIKALISMFDQRQESHRFVVLAPTGTAAALLNGSTYHSILGIRSCKENGEDEALKNEHSVIKEVQERLNGVDYIFIDEISMIACHELYAISSQLSKVTSEHNKPFGGKNIILAGDFAQLPPTNGFPLYSNNVSKTQDSSMSKRDQESTIGKILWHQITIAVILTQNMRQREITENDKKFRIALTNMRYAACTKEDIEFLRTLQVNTFHSDNSLIDRNFRNESIITSLNTQKDQINESCSIRFASETGQQLTHFYSIDKLGNADLGRKKRKRKASKKISANVDIMPDIQKTLWDSSPHTSEHFPGKLSLCLGMPIMIRNNDATELCITKGQEAYVVGWDSIDGPNGQKVIETLFLELKNPPKDIELPHLPKNVIPMTKTSKKIKCSLPNDHEINIVRLQINVLPNFSMTDYGSQGKTRIKNPVNLSHCKNFQSIYTCLSRGSNASGTLILQGFNSEKITKGLSGHLRQEFRELQLLENITKDIYEGVLDKKYFGLLRNPMLHKYQIEITKEFDNLPRALKFFNGENTVKEEKNDGTWNLKISQTLSSSNGGPKGKKRTLADLRSTDKYAYLEESHKKNRPFPILSQDSNVQMPLGLIWDGNDYSCAYDSFFTVLFHIWSEGPLKHKAYFTNGTQWIRFLHSNFSLILDKRRTFESVRDHLRGKLNHEKPLEYRYGQNYTNIDGLVRDIISTNSYGISCFHCLKCDFAVENPYLYFDDYTAVGWSSSDEEILGHSASIQSYLNYKIYKNVEETEKKCPTCLNIDRMEFPLYNTQCINYLPSVLIFVIAPWIDINKCLDFDLSNCSKKYVLKGIIYTNNNHFTARLVDEDLNVWFHDGQTTRSLCRKEQSLMQTVDIVPLKTYGSYKAIMAFYTEK